MSGTSVESALRHCEEVTRQRARNFYYGLRLMPEPKRGAMYAVYAWMRLADDLVDARDGTSAAGADAVRRARVDSMRRRVDALFSGELEPADRSDPVWIAMADTVSRYRLHPEPFHAMIDGQLEDLDRRAYRTFEELRAFCYRVASTVGLVCIELWGYSDPRARELAIDRGIAFQLTNILRDFREDHAVGRVYLPSEELEAAGLDAEALLAWRDPARCAAFVRGQAERAEGLYRRSAPLEGMITPTCVPTLWAMTRIYHGLLRKIERSPRRIVGSRRIRLNSLHKAAIALRAQRLASGAARETPAALPRPSST